ncbi:MAG TPA: SMP-30/gluconolactonase/LRE family protein [Coleofasciculaceae cyanobacterium]
MQGGNPVCFTKTLNWLLRFKLTVKENVCSLCDRLLTDRVREVSLLSFTASPCMLPSLKQIKQRLKQQFTNALKSESPLFPSLFPKSAKLEQVATGFQFLEGPVWIAEEQALYFSDIPANQILKLNAAGQISVVRHPSGNANGLTRDRQGRLVICEEGARQLTRLEPDGTITVLADRFQGKRLNSPNDVVVKSDGAIYFSDPPYGIKPEQQEQPMQAVYRLSPTGELTVVADDFDSPNGLAFSPDERQLYIDDSGRRQLRVFDVQPDGSLANGRLFFDLNVPKPGAPDGMKLDRAGRIYCTAAGGVWVLDAEGHHLGTIATPNAPSNCAWGDADGQTLYITAGDSVYKIRVNTPGAVS